MSILPSIWALNAFKTVVRVCSVSNSFSDFACFSLHEIIASDDKNRINIFFILVYLLFMRSNIQRSL